jgi:ribonuclease P protein component
MTGCTARPCGPGVMAGFHRRERVRRRAEYQRIYDQGVKLHGRLFTLFRFPNGLDIGRLGIAATRKLGGAVARNRAKRLIREVFRRNKLAPGFDIVIVPRRELLDAGLIALESEFRHMLARSARRGRSPG